MGFVMEFKINTYKNILLKQSIETLIEEEKVGVFFLCAFSWMHYVLHRLLNYIAGFFTLLLIDLRFLASHFTTVQLCPFVPIRSV